ncbi:MAG: penicillin-binding transpeptidase domain-containing protein, partial [Candidatus Roizmanbacteria bacterium]|nr:penicillin-binding transpeptidase domain-containing protein [Candidatus Roizmanbacteria bacterium]
PHFVFYVKSLLEKEYGERRVQEGGLRVYTTLDFSLQASAQKILSEELESLKGYDVGNGAVLVTRPSTGEILAMVGSRNFFDGSFGAFNVTTALRQPGSSIKPFTYTLALKEGMTAATLVNDTPTKFDIAGSAPYQPVNYDGKYHGLVSLRYALANSYNIPAVLLLRQVGVEDLVSFAQKLGLSDWENQKDRFGLSLTLGGGEINMIDFATAYGALRNLGVRHDTYPIQRIENSVGSVLFEQDTSGTRVMREEEPFIVSDMLADNIARSAAFGQNSAINFVDKYVSVKTGTTDEKRDNWTVGYTRPTLNSKVTDLLVIVWVGNNDNRSMNQGLVSGITGAAPIWRRIMEAAVNKELFNEDLYIPESIVSKQCYFGRQEYFVIGTEGTVNCQGLKPSTTPKE